MEGFVVSARKYRPTRFREVVGQEAVAQTLLSAIRSGHLAHSFLFCGPRGVGKTTCARIFAKTINCETPLEDGEACGECHSCHSLQQNSSFNIHELDAASNNSVDDIRQLNDQVRIPPQTGKFKIYIIDEVHMLSSSAFNAFLKTLEEPPAYAKFILATTEKHKIIPTILSRCQIYDFKRITAEDIVGHLQKICDQESIQGEVNALRIIGQKADGALRDALSLFDRLVNYADRSLTLASVLNNLNILDYDYFFRIMDGMLAQDLESLFLIIDEIIRKGYEPEQVITGLQDHFRNVLVAGSPHTAVVLEVGGDLRQRYVDASNLGNVNVWVNAIQLCHQFEMNYKSSKNKRLHVELLLLKLAHLVPVLMGKTVDLPPVPRSETVKTAPIITQPPEPLPTPSSSQELKRTPSLKELQQMPPASHQEEKKKISSPAPAQPSLPVANAESLFAFWAEWLFKDDQDGGILLKGMENKIILVDDVLTFQINHSLQQELIEGLIHKFRRFLESKGFTLPEKRQFELIHEPESTNPEQFIRKLQSPEEKLQKMTEKNPAVLTLQQTLQLGIQS